jgi:prepilin-type N-terminal cleavage/methylation domain-containing protein
MRKKEKKRISCPYNRAYLPLTASGIGSSIPLKCRGIIYDVPVKRKNRQQARAGFSLVEIIVTMSIFVILVLGIGSAISTTLNAVDMTIIESVVLGELQSRMNEISNLPWDDPASGGYPHVGTMDYAILSVAPLTFEVANIPGNGTIIVTNDIDGNPATTLVDNKVPALPYEGTVNFARVTVSYRTDDDLTLSIERYFARSK